MLMKPARPHWLALLPRCSPEPGRAQPDPAQLGLAWWALGYTPRVALLEEAVVLELGASLRLFGGLRALHRRLLEQGAPLGLERLAWAPNSLAALALARAQRINGLNLPLAELLDALPLSSLSAVAAQAEMLQRLGCQTLGQVRALPRAAAARRFGAALLPALDRAYGLVPEAHQWLALPERFEARLELPWRIEHSDALRQHAEALLRQLCAWLGARQAGITRLTLAWQHDAMRAREVGPGGALQLATAEASRDFGHLQRLLAEHLARATLAAPVAELRLSADEVVALDERSDSLLPDRAAAGSEPLPQLLERLAVRLGPQRVRQARLRADHRPECMQQWLAWGQALPASGPAPPPQQPQPSWLLEPPLRLLSRQQQPLYQGPLQLLAGPQRIEGGWWDAQPAPGHVQRDYYLARSERAGLLWIFLERLPASATGEAAAAWYLHGVFG